MPVPPISTLRSDAEDLIAKASRGQNEAILTGAIAATVVGTPLSSTATSQALITECQPLIDQAGNDVIAIQTREMLKLLEILAVTIAGGGAPPGTLTDGDKGDVTVSAAGVTWVINANKVTYAKMQDVSAAVRLIGRGAGVAGDPQEISLGTGLSMAGTVLNAAAGTGDALTSNPLSQFAATTSAQLAGVVFDETGTGLLVFNNGAVFIAVDIGVAQATSVNKVVITPPATGATLTIADGATLTAPSNATVSGTNTGDNPNATTVTVADAGGDTTTFLVLAGAATGNQAPLTDAGLTYNATTNALTVGTVVGALQGNADTVTTNANLTGDVTSVGNAATIPADTVTYAKMQNVSAISKLLGRGAAAGAGDVEEITLGSGLTMTGTTLAAAGGGGTGDVVGPASATDGVPALFDGTTGKLLKNSKVTLTQPATGATITVADGKTATFSNTITLVGTDGTTWTGPGTSFSVARIDAAQSFDGIQTFTTSLLNSQTALGAATADGLKVENITAAALGAQQWSPSIHWKGLGWGTTASTSQSVDFQAFVTPVQGTVPTGTWTLQSSINGGAYGTRLTIDSGGILTSTSTIISSVNVQSNATGSFNFGSSRSKITSPADGVVTLNNTGLSGFTRLNFGGTSTSFAAIGSSGTTLTVQLGDGTAGGKLSVSLPLAKVGGCIKEFYTDTGTPASSAETDFSSFTTIANTFAADGEKIMAYYSGSFAGNATGTSKLKIYFAGTAILDTGNLTVAAAGSWNVEVMLIRVSSTVVRCMVTFTTIGAATVPLVIYTELTGLTLSGTNILKGTMTLGVTNPQANDIVSRMGSVYWHPVST